MKLNHLNLVVSDLPKAVKLFEEYFGFITIEVKGDNAIAILKGADDFSLVIMTNKTAEFNYPDAFHIGFMQKTREDVDQLHSKLKAGGQEVGDAPKSIRNTYGFYFRFDRLMIEVGV